MIKAPKILFPGKGKEKVEIRVPRTRSQNPAPASSEEATSSSSSEEAMPFASSEEAVMVGEQASSIARGPILIKDSSKEDSDDVPLARRP